ncbi:Low-temperature-induced 65 kDa protein [Platanthera guangdongensis]|uniref:Low-temperature-induced 65 kDa protein n=1 Tax=Platanthera guangdongensis TaxID=2320717 RepID=A0ABR2LZL7_9ASPA
METLPAPSNPLIHGDHPPRSPGKGEENFEKKPVLKKVKDKVKKIKNTIANKARSHGDNGNIDDGDQHQHGDLDEGDGEDEELPEDTAIHGAQNYGSSAVDARIGDKEGGRGVGNEEVFESSTDAAKTREYGAGRRRGTEEVYGSSRTGGRSESIGTQSGGGTAGAVYGSSTPGERSRINEAGSSTAGKRTGASEVGRGGGGTEVNSVGLSGIKQGLKEDPDAPNSSTRTEMEQSRGGEEAAISPDLLSSLEAIGTSGQNGSGSKDLSDDTNRSNASVIPGANETGGEGRAISPELHRSFNAMSVSDPNGVGEAEVPQNKNSSYADKISAAKDAAFSAASESAVLGKKVASMVYQKAAGAGTAVMATVKPETGNDGVKPEIVKEDRDLAAGKQDKGGSVKDYVSRKLAPGEEDKALSEVITEALTPRKGDAVEAAAPVSPETSGSRRSGGGIGVVGRIKETVTSFLGGGGSLRESLAADGSKDFMGRTPEVLSQEKAP